MVKEEKATVNGQQKPTRQITKAVLKYFVGLRIQK